MYLQPTKVLLVLTAAIALLLTPHRLEAQATIGVVDFQRALRNTAELQKAIGELESKFKSRQEEIQKLNKELEEIQQKLQSATGTEAIGLQNDGRRKQRDVQRKTEDYQADVQFEQNEILQRTAGRMREVLQKLAQEKGLDLLVDTRILGDPIEGVPMYFKAALELTTEATAAYDKAYPVSTP